MAINTQTFVGPSSSLPIPTKITAPTCSPGSAQYIHGVVRFANSGNPASTVMAKQWAQGDVIVCGLSYESGPAPVFLSFPGQPKVQASPDPNLVYWVSPEYTSLWHLSWYFAYWQGHQIDVPLGFPNGTVTIRKWSGVIHAADPLVASSIVWQDSIPISFTVSSSAERLPEITVSNFRWVPNPVQPGYQSKMTADYHSNIPAAFMPVVFVGPVVSEVNESHEAPYRSIRHPVDAVWWQSGGGGACCNCKGYPIPPPNGCNGQETWSDWTGISSFGFTPSEPGLKRACIYSFYMPGGVG